MTPLFIYYPFDFLFQVVKLKMKGLWETSIYFHIEIIYAICLCKLLTQISITFSEFHHPYTFVQNPTHTKKNSPHSPGRGSDTTCNILRPKNNQNSLITRITQIQSHIRKSKNIK